jgi:endogenous inhibitor of DNA gyrase (YacG/DUF329 family)
MTHKCPICKKPTATETHAEFPFCSERCRLHDLGNWASEKYTISEPAFDDGLFDESGSNSPLGETRNHKDDRKN